MVTNGARDELLRLLDERVFDPILAAPASSFAGSDRRAFEDVRRSTDNEKHLYHEDYKTARSVKEHFLSELESGMGEKKERESERLGLPTMAAVRDELLALCRRLGL